MLYHCSTCNRSFRNQQALDRHLSPPAHIFNCSLCHRTFKSQQAYNQHIQYSAIHKTPVLEASNLQPSTTIQSQDLQPDSSSLGQLTGLRQRDAVTPNSTALHITNYNQESPTQDVDHRWSVIQFPQQLAVFDALSQNCHSAMDLKINKYRLQPDTAEDLAGLRKCRNCGGLARNLQKRASAECIFHTKSRDTTNRYGGQKPFPCCGSTTRGCTSLPAHNFTNPDPKTIAKSQSFSPTPPASFLRPKFRAVTLDCEMATIQGGGNDVILICAADYFTGAVLLNRLVYPVEPVTDWRSKIHGITRSAMQTAVRKGQALAGWKQAREELWKLIDEDTILVGHALNHDLDVLRMIHARMVDSAILARNAVGTGYPQWGLKTLCEELLKVDIRQNAKEVHDCLEDVLATREVVLWCTLNQPELSDWATAKRREEERKRQERRKAQQEKAKTLANAERGKVRDSNFESGSDEGDIPHWSDIAEACGWPHPDTGYDPWSD